MEVIGFVGVVLIEVVVSFARDDVMSDGVVGGLSHRGEMVEKNGPSIVVVE